MKGKVTFNTSGKGSKSGRVTIPVALLEVLEITELDREINIRLEGKKIIIEKVEKDMKNLVGKTWGELSEQQKEELLSIANAVNGVDGTRAKDGDCIVDFQDYEFSISGKIVEEVIQIDDNSIFYDPTK